jgi:uncharacterized protein YecE (DUF72 family)
MAILENKMSTREGLHVGTCGWSYPEWKGIFYGSRTPMLQQYLTYFDVAEINATFYGPLKDSFVEYLATSLPECKFFTAKIPHRVTHNNRLDLTTEAGELLTSFFEKMKPMRSRLEVLLIQLPPWDISTFANLETFLSKLDFTYRYAIEFRHKSWMTQRVWTLLEAYDIAHVIVDEPPLPIDLRVTTDLVYVRLHGHGVNPWYNYYYRTNELEAWRDRVNFLTDENDSVYLFFNNHFYGYGPTNAFQLLDLLEIINPRQRSKLERMIPHISMNQSTLDEF